MISAPTYKSLTAPVSGFLAGVFALLLAVTLPATAIQDGSGQESGRAVDDQAGAMAFIETLSQKTTNVWSNSDLTKDERDKAFFTLFEEAANIDYLSKYMMGAKYRTIPRPKFAEYTEAVKGYIIAEFDKRMAQIGFQALEVTGVTALPGRRGNVMVNTKVKRADGPDMSVKWRVDKNKGTFKVINMTVEGINMALVNRDYFTERLKKVGIDGLIKELRGS